VSNHSTTTTSTPDRASLLAPNQLPKVRTALLGLTLFAALLVWVAFSLGLIPHGTHLIVKLRVFGALTWLYAIVQIFDLKIWRSRFAQRRRAGSRIPEVLEGWLLGQMIAWFGIAYYALTDDPSWFIAGLLLLLLTFRVFPIRDEP
jgi:hypothetical protein